MLVFSISYFVNFVSNQLMAQCCYLFTIKTLLICNWRVLLDAIFCYDTPVEWKNGVEQPQATRLNIDRGDTKARILSIHNLLNLESNNFNSLMFCLDNKHIKIYILEMYNLFSGFIIISKFSWLFGTIVTPHT